MSPQPQAAVGAPLSRVDGRLKVTGQAKYAADHNPEGVVHAVIVDSSVGRGRITGIDTRAADAQPGVLKVISHLNAPRLPPDRRNFPPGQRLRVFQDDRIRFFGQPVAIVGGHHTGGRAARREPGEGLLRRREALDRSQRCRRRRTQTYARGDADSALDSAAVQLRMTYRMARNHHNPMEPPAIVAHWDGDRLTVWEKSQWVQAAVSQLAGEFGLPQENLRVISPFVGGAFGNATRTWPHSVAAALAAREVKRPVKLVLTRRQLFFGVGFRPAYEYDWTWAPTGAAA